MSDSSDKDRENPEDNSDDPGTDSDSDDDGEQTNQNNAPDNSNNDTETDNDNDSDSSDDDESNEEEEEASEDDGVTVTLDQDNIVKNAALDAAKRRYHNQVHQTPTGKLAAMRTPQEIFSLGNRIPWELVNPMGVNPEKNNESIFSYDISVLPPEERPWNEPDADPSDWFNYGFNEVTWEKYRKKMLKVIKNKKYESRINVLSEQTK